MTELLIWDSDQKIPEKQNRRLVIFWDGYDHTEFKEFGSLLVLVEKNAEKYRSEYLKLIHDAGIAVKEKGETTPNFWAEDGTERLVLFESVSKLQFF